MTLFYLIRHGKKEPISGDAPLSSQGLNQARATALSLREKPIQRIYSSPLRRAKETATMIASVHGLAVVEDIRLRERVNRGDLLGQSFTGFVEMWERSTHDPEYHPPIGDSARQAGERMEGFLRELAKTAPHEKMVIVTHGGLITDFMVYALPENQLERWHPAFLAEQSRLIPECSITKVSCVDELYTVVSFAEVEHLSGNDAQLAL